MKRNKENTDKLRKLNNLYREFFSLKSIYSHAQITDEYIWQWYEFICSMQTPIHFEQLLQKFIYMIYSSISEPIFKTSDHKDIDFLFLSKYPKNIQELLVRLILLDRKNLYRFIHTIDDLIMLFEFLTNPPDTLILLKTSFDNEVNSILKTILVYQQTQYNNTMELCSTWG